MDAEKAVVEVAAEVVMEVAAEAGAEAEENAANSMTGYTYGKSVRQIGIVLHTKQAEVKTAVVVAAAAGAEEAEDTENRASTDNITRTILLHR